MDLQVVVACVIGFFYACIAFFGMLWRFIRRPLAFTKELFYRKKRNVPPACLNDPSLGSHGFIHLEEVRLHYVISGPEGAPLMLFLHGFPEFWYSWRYQIREFNKEYRVVAIDMRGYADSDKPKGVKNYTVEKLISDIRQIVPALGYEHCVLVSHDWGGALAWNFASYHPEMVSKLIVMNCPHGAAFQKFIRKSWKQFKMSWYMFFFQMPFLPELMFSINDYNAMKMIFTGSKGGVKSDSTNQDDIEAYKYAASRQGGMTGPINYYRAALRFPRIFGAMPKIEKPVLLIWGKPDMALSTELAELSRQYCNNIKIEYVENSSHWVQMDKPDEVNQLMRNFLK